MATGRAMLTLARKHIGEKYVNVLVPKNNPNWKGPWDCAEFMSWLVYQEAEFLYGCTDNKGPPATTEAYTGAWRRDAQTLGIRISVSEAAATPGAFVLRYPPSPGSMGHIAICDGKGGTVEAKGKAWGVCADVVAGRAWDTGVLLPGVDYEPLAGGLDVPGPAKLYAIGLPNMKSKTVKAIQEKLRDAGFDPGPIDGVFGYNTAAAVAAFQDEKGLVVDGQVGVSTAGALGVAL